MNRLFAQTRSSFEEDVQNNFCGSGVFCLKISQFLEKLEKLKREKDQQI
jgi:hypothetical protein